MSRSSSIDLGQLRGRNPLVELNVDATATTQAAVGGSYIASIVQQETA